MSGIRVLKWKYDPGDKRTSGEIYYRVDTPRGLLVIRKEVGGGDPEVREATVAGNNLLDGDEELPDVDFPHASAGQYAVNLARHDAEKRILEAVTEWVGDAADKIEPEKAGTAGSGYCDCPCRDCFDIAISDDDGTPALCNECEDAGCSADGDCDCEREDAYDGADWPVDGPTRN